MSAVSREFNESSRREAMELQDQHLRMPLTEFHTFLDKKLKQSGTDVQLNRSDPKGDGDQSRITRNHQFYRDLFATGGDLPHITELGLEPLSEFARHCLLGNVDYVQKTLESFDQDSPSPPPELIRLLETRETALRLSPLLLLVSLGKNLSLNDDPDFPERQIQVAKLLLQHGARPDARDLCGKTVCHYGMGAMANDMTLDVVNCCVRAYKSSYLFGQKVLYNDKVGWCKGYDFDTNRRIIFLEDEKRTLAAQVDHLKLVDDSHKPKNRTKLCDIPDRLGGVCLNEVIQADRPDVAKILLEDYRADLDVQDCDGCSPRSLASGGASVFSTTAAMVSKAASSYATREETKKASKCCNCGKKQSPTMKLMVCALCHETQYCSKECQAEHWKHGGHKKECKRNIKKAERSIVLEPPKSDGMFYSTINARTKKIHGKQEMAAGYRKPSGVAVDERFDIKVQGGGKMMPLMIYDKSRQCNFTVSPESPGFEELRQAMSAEPAWGGRKIFVAASFNDKGKLTVYPGVKSYHKW